MYKFFNRFVFLFCFLFSALLFNQAYSKSYFDFSYSFQNDAQTKAEMSMYYTALASSDTNKINGVLQRLEPYTSVVNKAYAGALIMKKSGLLKAPKEKLKQFKQGKILLEEAIANDKTNAGYRFLRLVIQENCPAILNYKEHIKEDAETVKKIYMQFPEIAKNAVIDYAKNSSALKSAGVK